MLAAIAKWGNGHAIRLPKTLMLQAGISPTDKLSVRAGNGNIVFTKVKPTKAEKFLQAFSDYKGSWRCTELDAGDEVGKEVIE